MPKSTARFKPQTVSFIKQKFNSDCSILDMGAGFGYYSDYLKADFPKIDAVEIFEPYVEKFGLNNKYNKVFISDMCTFEFDYYDLILVGDVLEHIEESRGIDFISQIYNKCKELIVAIPFNSEQGECLYDNEYEIHRQPSLTNKDFLKKYKGFKPFCIRFDYGIYIKDTLENKNQPIILEEEAMPGTFEGIKNDMQEYPDSEILVITADEAHGSLDASSENDTLSIETTSNSPMHNNLTIVTGIWDLQRDQAGEGFKRPFSHYLENFKKLMQTDIPMVIYIEKKYEAEVWKVRKEENTEVRLQEVEDMMISKNSNQGLYEKIQKIRKNPDWYNQQGWLKESTQATLEMYNPMVMSKMFLLHNAKINNTFGTEYIAWLDGGITNTVHDGYFTHDKVLDKVHKYMDRFFFVSFPYEDAGEVHGFSREGMTKYAGERTKYVCRGGFFGGHIDYISEANGEYYGLLDSSLSEGYMGTEESIFTIMSYKDPDTYRRFDTADLGMVATFFEQVKNDKVEMAKLPKDLQKGLDLSPATAKVAVYVLTYNSPKQFEALVESYSTQPEFLGTTDKYLLNNSTDESTFEEYDNLCAQHGFTQIKKGNLGICGGRQFVAEHFNESKNDLYIFLEDDMTLVSQEGVCTNGLTRLVPKLLTKVKKIIIREGYDFIKFSFTEFYGDNITQWAWYNVPANERIKIWPDKPRLPRAGLDKNAPRTKFNNVGTQGGISYIDGEVYYCNWPQIVSRPGNKKIFIDTTWSMPHEQTWMSHAHQLAIEGEVRGAVLLASPIEHKRFDHYKASERKES